MTNNEKFMIGVCVVVYFVTNIYLVVSGYNKITDNIKLNKKIELDIKEIKGNIDSINLRVKNIESKKKSNKISNSIQYRDIINEVCTEYGIDRNLVCAIIKKESGFNRLAKNRSNHGLMQLDIKTFQYVNRKFNLNLSNIYDPHDNITAGVCYLKYLIDYKKDKNKALVFYNGGYRQSNLYPNCSKVCLKYVSDINKYAGEFKSMSM